MDPYSKKAFRIFRFLALFIIFIGIVMWILHKVATGRTSGRYSSGHTASLSGLQVIFLGLIMLLVPSFVIWTDKKK